MTAPQVVARWSASGPRLLSVLRIVTAFICLYFSAAGAGPWSLDAKREKHQG